MADILEELQQVCAAQNISLETLIETIDDARRNACHVTKAGDIVEDHSTRLQAVKLLVSMLQLPLRGKIAALKQGANAGESISDFLAKRLGPRAAIPAPPPPAAEI